MSRNIKLLISFIGLTTALVALLLVNRGDTSGIDKTIFQVDQERIDRVTFTSKNKVIELLFDGTKWKVDGRDADRQMITVLFATVLQTQPKRQLNGAQRDSVAARIKLEGVRVGLFENTSSKKEFLVCGNQNKTETYFQLVGDENIYLVAIPGYRVYVASIFEQREEGWRDKSIFNFNWQNFKELKAHFPTRQKQDFSVTLVNSLFSIAEVPVADTTKLSGFLEACFKLKAEQILSKTESERYDSLLQKTPVMEIVIRDISKRQIELLLYPTQKIDRLVLARWNQNEIVLLSPRAVAGILRGRDFFVLK